MPIQLGASAGLTVPFAMDWTWGISTGNASNILLQWLKHFVRSSREGGRNRCAHRSEGQAESSNELLQEWNVNMVYIPDGMVALMSHDVADKHHKPKGYVQWDITTGHYLTIVHICKPLKMYAQCIAHRKSAWRPYRGVGGWSTSEEIPLEIIS